MPSIVLGGGEPKTQKMVSTPLIPLLRLTLSLVMPPVAPGIGKPGVCP